MKSRWLPCLCLVVACARGDAAPPASAAQASRAPDRGAAAVQSVDLQRWIAKLSADELQGRAPATPGDAAARAYIAAELNAIGLEPGDGTQWEQPFELLSVTSKMPAQWTFQGTSQSLALALRDQYVAVSGASTATASVEDAEVVFVGYGIQAPEYGWDDFKQRDLRGKVLLMLNNDPDWDPALFAGGTRLYYGRWSYKYESAARQGAAGAIVIHTTASAGYPFSVLQSGASGPQFELPSSDPRCTIEAWVTEDAARSLVSLAGKDLAALIRSAKRKDFEPVSLGLTTSIAFQNDVTTARSANVLGMLRGADPVLQNQLVVYSAHHDHLGIGDPDGSGDAIYNGALDNAAGVAQLLSIAKAFKASPTPPKRSLLFLFVGGEEQGLLGSRYFAAHPIVPAGSIAANINYDSGNIWGRTRDVTYVGMGKSTLDGVVIAAAREQGRTVKPDQFPDRGYFYRSDQFSFAKIGVPAVFLGTGTDFVGRPEAWGRQQIELYETHHYHQPSDELTPEWSFDGMVEDARLGYRVGIAIANQPELPAWLPGDEFEAARKAALADD